MKKNIVGVVFALEKEAQPFLERIFPVKKGRIFYGNYKGTNFAVAVSGYGKVKAASATQHLVDYNPARLSHIVHLGVAGGIDPSLKIGDIVAPVKIIEYDVQALFNETLAPEDFKNHEILIANPYADYLVKMLNPITGICLSGDRDVVDPKVRAELRKIYNALSADWESFAVAKVCEINSVPCAVLRGISDNADENAASTFNENVRRISKDLAERVLGVYAR